MPKVYLIAIDRIKIGEHDQRIQVDDESIITLAESIQRVGLLYPIIVRPDGEGYMLVEGHRRLAAHKLMGKKEIMCMVTESGLAEASEVAFAGNYFRKDLSPVERAHAIKDCYTKGVLTVAEMAEGFRKKEHWVTAMMAIADWPDDVQEAIHNERISVSAANNLALVTDDTYRAFLVRNAIEGGATARTTAAWLQAWRSMAPMEEAIEAEPVPGQAPQVPATPQAPCFCCGQMFPVTQMSHVPIDGACIQIIRAIHVE